MAVPAPAHHFEEWQIELYGRRVIYRVAGSGPPVVLIHGMLNDMHGQRVSATDRLNLLEAIPTLIVWGERDRTIPIEHGRLAHAAIPGSRFETLPSAAHFPHLEDPEGLARMLSEFLRTTRPGAIDDADWGAIVARRSPRSRRLGDVA
ncbi:MAG TPA: alpha/beta fold hydrolase [Solirubrobacteraceae bacterium]